MKKLNNNGDCVSRPNERLAKLIVPLTQLISDYGLAEYRQRLIEISGVICPYTLAYTVVRNFKLGDHHQYERILWHLERQLLDELLEGLQDKDTLIGLILEITHYLRPMVNQLLENINWQLSDTYLLNVDVCDDTNTNNPKTPGSFHAILTLGTFAT